MKAKGSIADIYLRYFKERHFYRVMYGLIGEKYVLADQFGLGDLLRHV